MIERMYKCDLCSERREPRQLVGLYWENGRAIKEVLSHDSEHHICFACLSSLQRFEKRCGAGFKCSGGPNCTSDHK